MMDNYVNRVIQIMLDLAVIADERQETPFDRELGLGYRAFTSYIRKGVEDIVKLQSNYYSACENRDYAKSCLKINEELLEKVFGSTEVPEFNDDEIARIKAVVSEIEEEWSKDDE